MELSISVVSDLEKVTHMHTHTQEQLNADAELTHTYLHINTLPSIRFLPGVKIFLALFPFCSLKSTRQLGFFLSLLNYVRPLDICSLFLLLVFFFFFFI